jgi:hypothetical protein
LGNDAAHVEAKAYDNTGKDEAELAIDGCRVAPLLVPSNVRDGFSAEPPKIVLLRDFLGEERRESILLGHGE